MTYQLAVIGTGQMGSALIRGILSQKALKAEEVILADPYQPSLDAVQADYPEVSAITDNIEAVKSARVILLAVKPQGAAAVLEEIQPHLSPDQLILTIITGRTFEYYQKYLGQQPLVRAMPNTPVKVNEGLIAWCPNDYVSPEQAAEADRLFSACGQSSRVAESQLQAISAVTGASPAYTYMYIEAMADAGVAAGLSRRQAQDFAAQAVLGAARMVLVNQVSPAQLKDQVCSPGGTTIAGVEALERGAFRGTVMSAIRACIERDKQLSAQ